MKIAVLVQLAAFSTAFVLPNEQVNSLQHVEMQRPDASVFDRLPSKSDIINSIEHGVEQLTGHLRESAQDVSDKFKEYKHSSKHALDEAFENIIYAGADVSDRIHDTYFDAQGWLDGAIGDGNVDAKDFDLLAKKPCHGQHKDEGGEHPFDEKHDEAPHNDHSSNDGLSHALKPPHHGPPHHHHKLNQTVYQLIASSKYTTKLAALINKYDDLVAALNSTEVGNITVFAPTDKAFEKIPEHAPKPSKEQLKSLLLYHISPDFYPAGRILVSRTIPTQLVSESLADKPKPQRLSTNIGVRGLTVNFYSRVVAVDIFGTNGVIHGVDSIIIPPPKTIKIIDLLPTEFSTLELGLGKTGLLEELNTTDHNGGTFFAPSNFAFQKLGPRINAFLFSSYGQKYLKALLKYHVVPGQTLYSDAYYGPSSEDKEMFPRSEGKHDGDRKQKRDHKEKRDHKKREHKKRDSNNKPYHGDDKHKKPHHGVPKGLFHVDLPTLLEDKHLSVDIARYGRLMDFKINAFARVAVLDGVAEDGVLHVVGEVLIPPKKIGGAAEFVAGGEMTVEELKERLEPFVEKQQGSWFDL